MFKKVVVGIDGRSGGDDALALARLLSAEDTELTLVNVYPEEPVTWRGVNHAYEDALRQDSERILEAARTGVDADLATHPSPDVGRGLHEVADLLHADLIIVGSSRKGYLGRVFTGDDTRRALNGAACAVAVAPSGFAGAEARLHTIGVGYDGSPESEHALAFARDLAGERQATVAAMQVLDFPARYFVGPAWPDHSAVAKMMDQVRDQVALIKGVEARVASGIPGEELARFSESVDLMVVGSRGYGPLGRVLYGSVGQALARMARSPLLVIPRAADEPAATYTDAGVANAAL